MWPCTKGSGNGSGWSEGHCDRLILHIKKWTHLSNMFGFGEGILWCFSIFFSFSWATRTNYSKCTWSLKSSDCIFRILSGGSWHWRTDQRMCSPATCSYTLVHIFIWFHCHICSTNMQDVFHHVSKRAGRSSAVHEFYRLVALKVIHPECCFINQHCVYCSVQLCTAACVALQLTDSLTHLHGKDG